MYRNHSLLLCLIPDFVSQRRNLHVLELNREFPPSCPIYSSLKEDIFGIRERSIQSSVPLPFLLDLPACIEDTCDSIPDAMRWVYWDQDPGMSSRNRSGEVHLLSLLSDLYGIRQLLLVTPGYRVSVTEKPHVTTYINPLGTLFSVV